MSSKPTLPSIHDIRKAHETIKDTVHQTPILSCRALSRLAKGDLYFKCENFQLGGAFKIRGAYNRLAQLNEEEMKRGVVAYSSGNHAQGVALAAQILGIQATIFMPVDAPKVKLAGVKGYGAEAIMVGTTSAQRREAALEFSEETGAVVIPPFDDFHIIAGQGTVGLEMALQVPDVTRVVVPIGGGGLISGISIAVKALKPEVEIIGVEPELAAKMANSLAHGEITETIPGDTLGDGLKPVKPGKLTFAAVQKNVDRVVTVGEREIAAATKLIMERAKIVVEPSGAVTLAACLFKKIDCSKGKTVLVFSGGNVDLEDFVRKTGSF